SCEYGQEGSQLQADGQGHVSTSEDGNVHRLGESCHGIGTNGVCPRPYDGPVAKARAAVVYACTECGYSSGRWFGKCPSCAAFGTLEEERGEDAKSSPAPRPLLRLVDVEAEAACRISTGVAELDRVLGGGLVPASLVLVGGEPGVGKSTLLLTALRAVS